MTDSNNVEELVRVFKVGWVEKCHEVESLRLLLKELSEETSKTNYEYNELGSSLSNFRHQFGHTVNANVSKLEELSIVSSAYWERINKLEAAIKNAYNHYKDSIKGRIAVDLPSSVISNIEQIDHAQFIGKLQTDVERMHQTLSSEWSLQRPGIGSKMQLNEEVQRNTNDVYAGIITSLELQLEKLQKIDCNQGKQNQYLEKENKKINEIKMIKGDANEKQIEKVDEILHIINAEIINLNDTNFSTLISLQGNIRLGKRVLIELYDNMMKFRDYMTEDIRKMKEKINLKISNGYPVKNSENIKSRVSVLQDENHILREHLEETERNYEISIDELDIMRKRVISIEKEHKACAEEVVALKDGEGSIQDQCCDLDGENKKLKRLIRKTEVERDILISDLENQKKTNSKLNFERRTLANKCENFEEVISKLKQEYKNITRELNGLNCENEELKKSIQDFEREYMLLSKNLKSAETDNKDLGDQLLQLTSDNQKLNNYKRIKCNLKERNTVAKDLEDKLASDEKVREIEKYLSQVDLNKTRNKCIKIMSVEPTEKGELLKEKEIILLVYEKLLRKLLYQRKEIISLIHIDDSERIKNNFLNISSLESEDHTSKSEIEGMLRQISSEVDSSYNALVKFLKSLDNKWNIFKHSCKELLQCVNVINAKGEDSRCSTNCESIESMVSHLRRDIKNLTSWSENIVHDDFENIGGLVTKIKILMKHSPLSETRKSKKSRKIIHQVQSRLRKRKIVENNRRVRLITLSRKLKYSKCYQNEFNSEKLSRNCKNFTNGSAAIVNSKETFGYQYMHSSNVDENLKNFKNELKALVFLMSKFLDKKNKLQMFSTFHKIATRLSSMYNDQSNTALSDSNEEKLNLESGNISNELNLLKERRMIKHIRFTNKRLKLLLKRFEGREVSFDTKKEQLIQKMKISTNNPNNLLKSERHSLKSDEDLMKTESGFLEVTKAISMPDINKMSKDKNFDEEKVDTLNLIKLLDENIEHVLKVQVIKSDQSESTFTLTAADNEVGNDFDMNNKSDNSVNDASLKMKELGKESELKLLLENAQKIIENLSVYLIEREAELRKRDKMITMLYKEYEGLHKKASGNDRLNNSASDRIIAEYVDAKNRLEKENSFLQLAVKEIREELMNLHKEYRREEETQKHLQDYVNELHMCKHSLEECVNKMTCELNIVTGDRNYLLQTMQMATIKNMHSKHTCCRAPYSPRESLNQEQCICLTDIQYYKGCSLCLENSGSSAVPFSDEEWISAASCDDYDSLLSGTEHLDEISTSDSQTKTCSKLAVNVKTKEVTERIKLRNRPLKYQHQETRTRKQILPQSSEGNVDCISLDASTDISLNTKTSFKSNDSRVLGRRENNTKSGGNESSNSGSVYYKKSSSVTSYDSIPSSPASVRYNNSFKAENHLDGYLSSNHDETFNEANISPFLNPKYECKKRKKRFLQFGKK